jgi:hypothetical protein
MLFANDKFHYRELAESKRPLKSRENPG